MPYLFTALRSLTDTSALSRQCAMILSLQLPSQPRGVKLPRAASCVSLVLVDTKSCQSCRGRVANPYCRGRVCNRRVIGDCLCALVSAPGEAALCGGLCLAAKSHMTALYVLGTAGANC